MNREPIHLVKDSKLVAIEESKNEQTISKPDRKHDVTSLRFCKVYGFKNCI